MSAAPGTGTAIPGARCDVESLDYSYSFSDELQQEWRWTERYASQPEILRYLNHVADRFDLRRDIQFDTRVERRASTTRAAAGRSDRARRRSLGAVLHHGHRLPVGPAIPPHFPGLDAFPGALVPHRALAARGRRLHRPAGGGDRHRLVGDPVDPADRRAGRASVRVPAHRRTTASRPTTRPLDAGTRAAGQGRATPSVRQQARKSRDRLPSMPVNDKLGAVDVPPDERERELRGALAARRPRAHRLRSTICWSTSEANETAAEFVRDKIREIVHDPEVAEMLAPRDYPFGTKRMCVDTDYYETFNRDNVTLVDLRQRRRSRRSRRDGLRTADGEYAAGRDRLRHRLRRDDRRVVRASTFAAAAVTRCAEKWPSGPAHLSRPRGRRLPEPVHDHRAGQPVGAEQHAGVDRAARRLDRGLHRLPARARRCDNNRSHAAGARRPGSRTSTRSAT